MRAFQAGLALLPHCGAVRCPRRRQLVPDGAVQARAVFRTLPIVQQRLVNRPLVGHDTWLYAAACKQQCRNAVRGRAAVASAARQVAWRGGRNRQAARHCFTRSSPCCPSCVCQQRESHTQVWKFGVLAVGSSWARAPATGPWPRRHPATPCLESASCCSPSQPPARTTRCRATRGPRHAPHWRPETQRSGLAARDSRPRSCEPPAVGALPPPARPRRPDCNLPPASPLHCPQPHQGSRTHGQPAGA